MCQISPFQFCLIRFWFLFILFLVCYYFFMLVLKHFMIGLLEILKWIFSCYDCARVIVAFFQNISTKKKPNWTMKLYKNSLLTGRLLNVQELEVEIFFFSLILSYKSVFIEQIYIPIMFIIYTETVKNSFKFGFINL